MALVFILVRWIFEIVLKLIYPTPLFIFTLISVLVSGDVFPIQIPEELIARANKGVPEDIVVLVLFEKPKAKSPKGQM